MKAAVLLCAAAVLTVGGGGAVRHHLHRHDVCYTVGDNGTILTRR